MEDSDQGSQLSCFHRWMNLQEQDLSELLQGLTLNINAAIGEDHTAELSQLVDKNITHFEEYATQRASLAREDASSAESNQRNQQFAAEDNSRGDKLTKSSQFARDIAAEPIAIIAKNSMCMELINIDYVQLWIFWLRRKASSLSPCWVGGGILTTQGTFYEIESSSSESSSESSSRSSSELHSCCMSSPGSGASESPVGFMSFVICPSKYPAARSGYHGCILSWWSPLQGSRLSCFRYGWVLPWGVGGGRGPSPAPNGGLKLAFIKLVRLGFFWP
ncbi:hypothetical protein BUALT_Bualt03G0044400 [Buddleja alternifolia]|uniref:Uncharacterized protein n=1 Tax=Buddleja alternifolia TaxID=168488 RepID=A0AAV6XYF5_9LAMI|nr:hypothetical protein BUALT_Bualt03G0044400 [Buddleja alternifolia]